MVRGVCLSLACRDSHLQTKRIKNKFVRTHATFVHADANGNQRLDTLRKEPRHRLSPTEYGDELMLAMAASHFNVNVDVYGLCLDTVEHQVISCRQSFCSTSPTHQRVKPVLTVTADDVTYAKKEVALYLFDRHFDAVVSTESTTESTLAMPSKAVMSSATTQLEVASIVATPVDMATTVINIDTASFQKPPRSIAASRTRRIPSKSTRYEC